MQIKARECVLLAKSGIQLPYVVVSYASVIVAEVEKFLANFEFVGAEPVKNERV